MYKLLEYSTPGFLARSHCRQVLVRSAAAGSIHGSLLSSCGGGGGGSSDDNEKGVITHTYASVGTFTIDKI